MSRDKERSTFSTFFLLELNISSDSVKTPETICQSYKTVEKIRRQTLSITQQNDHFKSRQFFFFRNYFLSCKTRAFLERVMIGFFWIGTEVRERLGDLADGDSEFRELDNFRLRGDEQGTGVERPERGLRDLGGDALTLLSTLIVGVDVDDLKKWLLLADFNSVDFKNLTSWSSWWVFCATFLSMFRIFVFNSRHLSSTSLNGFPPEADLRRRDRFDVSSTSSFSASLLLAEWERFLWRCDAWFISITWGLSICSALSSRLNRDSLRMPLRAGRVGGSSVIAERGAPLVGVESSSELEISLHWISPSGMACWLVDAVAVVVVVAVDEDCCRCRTLLW